MRRIAAFALALVLSAALPAPAQSVSKDPAQAPAGPYSLDTRHSQVLFSVLHQGLTDYHGRFDTVSGTLAFDGKQPEKSALSVTIDTSSLDLPSPQLTGSVKSVFRTQEFPTAVFKSTAITRSGPDSGQITGTLTIRDVTKPVTLSATFNGGERNPLGGGYALGFHATGTIKRSDFDLTHMIWSSLVSDEVQLTIEAEFDRQKV